MAGVRKKLVPKAEHGPSEEQIATYKDARSYCDLHGEDGEDR